MQNPASPAVFAATLVVFLLPIATTSCRELPPVSGTPLRSGESLDDGVVRSQHVGSTRPVSLLVSTARVAADVAALVESAGDAAARVRVLRTENRTGLPESSFIRLRRQLVQGVVDAGRLEDVEFVTGDDGGPADYVLHSRAVGALRGEGYFLFDYELVRNGDDREAAVWTASHAVASN